MIEMKVTGARRESLARIRVRVTVRVKVRDRVEVRVRVALLRLVQLAHARTLALAVRRLGRV